MGTVRGNHVAEVGGRQLTFQFTYAALEQLHATYGTDWETLIRDRMAKLDITLIVTVAAAGLAAHHPELGEAAIREWSPPVNELIVGCSLGLVAAFKGVESAEGKQRREEEARRDLTRFWTLWSWRKKWASRRASSGGSAPLN